MKNTSSTGMVPEVFFAFNPINRILHGSGLEEPEKLFLAYDEIWKGQFTEGQNNIDYFYKVRDEFNGFLKKLVGIRYLTNVPAKADC